MKTLVKVLLIWCIVLLENPERFTLIWWFCMVTFVLSLISDVREFIKFNRDE